MDRLWSPWRLAYVTGTPGSASSSTSCIFCDASSDLLIVRGAATYVILNLYPYNNGHLMVVPNRHIGSLAAATPAELSELMLFTRHAEVALTEAYQPHGINIGVNIGRAAGAGVLDHVHIHVVPRWHGDTNFMSVIGETRVLPEDLSQTAKKLKPLFEQLMSDRI